jgi:hypothetical protein
VEEKSMTHYTLTLTDRQMHVISRACEVIARLGIGQLPEALRELPKPDSGIDWIEWNTDCEAVCKIMSKYLPGNINGWNSNLSIHHADNGARIAWDLHQVIRHRLAWDSATARGITDGTTRDWSQMLGVHFDAPSKTAEEPLATVGREQEVSALLGEARNYLDGLELADRIDAALARNAGNEPTP